MMNSFFDLNIVLSLFSAEEKAHLVHNSLLRAVGRTNLFLFLGLSSRTSITLHPVTKLCKYHVSFCILFSVIILHNIKDMSVDRFNSNL